ncbi:Glutamate receptor ionotropic, kainate 1 [Cichlidogyrus casuarinus]|uniref:Glutamate receptor ionotropic, kainate 1 n=1 Tax=Cichlidogyrus casuarinus TaxID=1844966 RepID=A0ABD2QAV8_9PLAT
MLARLSFCLILLLCPHVRPVTYNIGAVFEKSELQDKSAFIKVISKLNDALDKSSNSLPSIQFKPIVETIEDADPIEAHWATCQLLNQDAIAILGPRDPLSSEQVQAVSNRYLVPYFKMQWSYHNFANESTFNMHPEYQVIGQLVYDFTQLAKDWDSEIVIFYSKDESLAKFQYLFTNHRREFLLRKWRRDQGNPFKYFRTKGKQMKWFIVDIPYQEIGNFVSQLAENQMNTTYYNFFFTDLDFPFVNPTTFANIKANITGLSLLKFTSSLLTNESSLTENYSYMNDLASDTRAALIQDSVTYIARVVLGLHRNRHTSILPEGRKCTDKPGSSEQNKEFLDALRSADYVSSQGDKLGDYITHRVEFEKDNPSRTFLNLTLLSNLKDRIEAASYWIRSNDKKGLVLKTKWELQLAAREYIKGKILRVTTKEEHPYVIYKLNSATGRSSNPSDWTGMCIEILKYIANKLKFEFKIQEVADGGFGNVNRTDPSRWTGMIGELMEEKADLALTMLTITAERNKVVKFTIPYKNLGISILYRKPPKKPYSYKRFLDPFSRDLWGYVITAYIMVSFVLYLVARFTPYEWYNPHPCNQNSEVIENNFNMLNTFWFVIGSLMQQGIDIVPRATSTRIIAGCWWFFTLIIIASYTANLAAFLTVERMKPTIESAKDLVESRIKYGTIKDGSTFEFFSKSNNDIFRRMYKHMQLNEAEVMQSKSEHGVERVRTGTDYAFILESTTNDYWTKRNCELLKIGPNLDSKGYGFGLPKSSPYDGVISEEILGMLENNKIAELEKEFYLQGVTNPCSDQTQTNMDTSSLGFDQMSGCFLMVLIALVSALLVSFFEFSVRVFKLSKNSGRSMGEEMAREFRFSMSRSNKRNRRIEEECVLPSLPKHHFCCNASEAKATLAYAPCLSRPHEREPEPTNADLATVPLAQTLNTPSDVTSGASMSSRQHREARIKKVPI